MQGEEQEVKRGERGGGGSNRLHAHGKSQIYEL